MFGAGFGHDAVHTISVRDDRRCAKQAASGARHSQRRSAASGLPGGPLPHLKIGKVGAVKFEERIRELTEGMPDLAEIAERLLRAPQAAPESCRPAPQASGDRPG